MFIKVTNAENKNVSQSRVNINLIEKYDVSGTTHKTHGVVTCICFAGDVYMEVLETPEQIDAKLAKLGISVGGEY